MLSIVLVSMVVLAISSLQARSLKMAVILLSVFSLLSSFSYVFLAAPDVALAEAAIGVGLSTVLYLVAIKKFRAFRVYYHSKVDNPDYLPVFHAEKKEMELSIRAYLDESDIELELINTKETTTEIRKKYDYDLIISHKNDRIKIYGLRSNYLYSGLVDYLLKNELRDIDYEYLLEEGESLSDMEGMRVK